MSAESEKPALSGDSLNIKLEGPGIKGGTVNTADLAALLDSLNRLLQRANKEIYGKDSKIELRFCGGEKGSFVADFIISNDIKQFALDNKEAILAISVLLNLIFQFSDKIQNISGGAIALLKWLRGKKPDKIEHKDGKTYVHNGDNYFITSPESLKLAENSKIRTATQKLAALTNKKSIDSLSASVPHSRPIKLSKKDIPAFAELESKGSELLYEGERTTILEIISPDFNNAEKWVVSEGEKPFTAAIEDEEFFRRVKNKEQTFRKGDCVKCLICERQYVAAHGLKKETEILQILDFIESKPSGQLELFSGNG